MRADCRLTVDPAVSTAPLIAQIVLTLFVFFMLLNSAAVLVYVERKVAALHAAALRPVPGRAARDCCSRSPTSSS